MKRLFFREISVLCCAVLIGLTMVGCPPKPEPAAAIGLSETALAFEEASTQLTFEVSNTGDDDTTLTFTAASTTAWITDITPAQGTSTGADDAVLITVTIDRAGLEEGDYTGAITVGADELADATVAVSMTVGPTGKVTGWVDDAEGNMLPQVKVTVGTSLQAYTDGHGLFIVEEVPSGIPTTVTYALDDYAPASRVVSVGADESASANATLLRLDEGEALANVENGGEVVDTSGNALNLPQGALADDAGKALSGEVSVHISIISLDDPEDLAASPGTFEGNDASGTVLLEAYAMANFLVERDGDAVSLQANASAGIQLALPGDTELEAGDEVPLWYFDVSAGIWVQNGTATVGVDIETSHLVCSADVSFFGWWSCGAAIPAAHTISGRTLDEDGEPQPDALVRAVGQDYCGRSFARSDESGEYVINVKPNANVRLDLIPRGAYYVVDSLELLAGDAGAYTVDQDLMVSFDACISGYVTEEDEVTPVADTEVRSSAGGVAITDADGYYCMGAPAETWVAVYVPGRPPRIVYTPEAATCAGEDCAEVNLFIDYPEDGDLVGLITAGISRVGFLLTKPNLWSMAMFYSGFDGDGFDLYDTEVTADSCDVYTLSFTPHLSLGIYVAAGMLLGQEGAMELAFGLDFNMTEVFSLDWGKAARGFRVPKGHKIGALYPGAPGTVTNGTETINMVTPLDHFRAHHGGGEFSELDDRYQFLQPWMSGFFHQEDFLNEGFDFGDTLTYTWPGGLDLGAFSVSGVMPGELTFTAPDSLQAISSEDALANGLTVEWDTENTGDFITLVVQTVVIDNSESLVDLGVIVCRLIDDGSYTIPAEKLAELPQAEGNISLKVNYLLAIRRAVATADVPLVHNEGNGYVALLTGPAPTNKFSVEVDLSIGKEGDTLR